MSCPEQIFKAESHLRENVGGDGGAEDRSCPEQVFGAESHITQVPSFNYIHPANQEIYICKDFNIKLSLFHLVFCLTLFKHESYKPVNLTLSPDYLIYLLQSKHLNFIVAVGHT